MQRYVVREYKECNNYVKGCPLIIKKVRLLYDNETDLVLLQMSLKNVSCNEKIKKVYLLAETYDENDKIILKNLEIELDANIDAQGELKIEEPIIIEEKKTQKINLIIKKVIFDDGVYKNQERNIGTEIQAVNLIDTSSELYKATKFYDKDIILNNYPIFNNDYWICSCANLNDDSLLICSNCNQEKKVIKSFFEDKNCNSLIESYKNDHDKLMQKKELEKRKKSLFALKTIIICVISIVLTYFLGTHIWNVIEYNEAEKLYESKNYEAAILNLELINTKKGNKLLNDIYYDYALELIEDGYYLDGIDYLKSVDYPNDEGKINQGYYEAVKGLIDEKEYEDALYYYSKAALYDSDSTKEMFYQVGIDVLNEGKDEKAIDIFNEIISYKDTAEYINKAKYNYVLNHLNIDNSSTRNYIKELKEINYSNIHEVYDNLIKWKVLFYSNTNSYSEDSMTQISHYDTIYHHFEISGGGYKENIDLDYKIIYPGGSVGTGNFYNFTSGDPGYVYIDPYYGYAGYETIIIYNSNTGEELGRHSVYRY